MSEMGRSKEHLNLLIFTYVIYRHYKTDSDTDYGDSAETINQNIYDAMNNFSEQKSISIYIVVHTHMVFKMNHI